MAKILYVVWGAELGGHILSAFTVAKEVQGRGYQTAFAARTGALSAEIAKVMPFSHVDMPVYHGEHETYFTWQSFAAIRQIRELVREQQVTLIHAFDARSYFHCYPVGLLTGVPVLCTLCGGTDPYYNVPRADRLIVFSEEQKQKMVGQYRWPQQRVAVYRARVDLSKVLADSERLAAQEAEEFGIETELPRLMMLTSFGDLKIHGILNLVEAVDLVCRRQPVVLVLIGGKPCPSRDAVCQAAEAVNRRHGYRCIRFLEQMPDAHRFLKLADVVLGVGRSAFEGMAYGKPTVIVGNGGFAGVVNPADIEALAHYNFSGRNQRQMLGPEVLAEVIGELLDNRERSAELGEYARKYVVEQIDVTAGGAFMTSTYRELQDRAVMPTAVLGDCLSYLKCLVPVLFDNGTYRIKGRVRRLWGRLSRA